jgi:hypothetical protein
MPKMICGVEQLDHRRPDEGANLGSLFARIGSASGHTIRFLAVDAVEKITSLACEFE